MSQDKYPWARDNHLYIEQDTLVECIQSKNQLPRVVIVDVRDDDNAGGMMREHYTYQIQNSTSRLNSWFSIYKPNVLPTKWEIDKLKIQLMRMLLLFSIAWSQRGVVPAVLTSLPSFAKS
jgi:hypothetical protein